MVHFDLKSWVTGGTKIWPWIPSNLTQIFSNYLESWVDFYFRKWLNFLGQNDFFISVMEQTLPHLWIVKWCEMNSEIFDLALNDFYFINFLS